MLNRRSLLTAAGASFAASALEFSPLALAAAPGLKLGPPAAFSFDLLAKEAQARAARAYEPPPMLPEKITTRIDTSIRTTRSFVTVRAPTPSRSSRSAGISRSV
jgi:glucans biosynthesis protein